MLDYVHKIAEIVAAFSVVASLIFVGYQLQQNTEALGLAAIQSNTDAWHATSLATATNPQLIEAQIAVQQGNATPVEAAQAFFMRITVLKSVETSYHLWKDGHMSDELWAATESSFVAVLEGDPQYEETITTFAPRHHTAGALAFFQRSLAEAKASNQPNPASED